MHMHMNVLSTRLEFNDRRHDQEETCPHDIAIREENWLLNLKLLAVPIVILMLFPLTVLLFMFLHM